MPARRLQILFIFLFLIVLNGNSQPLTGSPTVQDCLGAIPVCQPVYTTTASYTGHGNVYPEIKANSLCPLCMDGEKNDVFYVITVQTSGLLRFTLTPNNPTNDYDWSLFNMTNANCDQIYSQAVSLQVSCNSYGITGTNGPTGINTLLGNNLNCNGPGVSGSKFNKDVTVVAGQTYVLNVSNWSSTNQSGYTLDFSGSTASIFDITPARIDSIQTTVSCAGSGTLFLKFSENVKCMDVYHHEEKFSLTGPAGNYTISDVISTDCGTGATNGRSFSLVVSPPLGAGSYDLNIIGDIRDLCDNVCVYKAYPFHLTEINAPAVTAGNDTSVANGAIIALHGAATGGAGPYSYHWEPAGFLVNPNVAQPLTINLGATVHFTLSVTDQAGCHGNSDVIVTVVGGPLGVVTTSSPETICAGGQSVLNATVSGGSGNYSYSWTSVPPGFTSMLMNPTVTPLVTTTYNLQVSDGFSNISGNTTVHVNPKPVADAGTATSILYGTNTTLHGSATAGSGNYSYYWTSLPPGFSSAQQNPAVTNLVISTVFQLVVTDVTTGCVSEPAMVTITVTGSPLQCNPVANPAILCLGTATQLFAMAGGGSGSYTWAWSSIPPGFTSTAENPMVSPLETTSYTVSVNDGFNTKSGLVNVTVRPKPVFPAWGTDTVVCIFDTLKLDAGNPGGSYYWSNGATTQTIIVQSTGVGADNQYYLVKVVNDYGCLDSADVTVDFSFDACTGIDELPLPGTLRIHPNPASGILHLELNSTGKSIAISVVNALGIPVISEQIRKIQPGIFTRDYDFSRLPKGLYLFRVTDGDLIRVAKVVRQ